MPPNGHPSARTQPSGARSTASSGCPWVSSALCRRRSCRPGPSAESTREAVAVAEGDVRVATTLVDRARRSRQGHPSGAGVIQVHEVPAPVRCFEELEIAEPGTRKAAHVRLREPAGPQFQRLADRRWLGRKQGRGVCLALRRPGEVGRRAAVRDVGLVAVIHARPGAAVHTGRHRRAAGNLVVQPALVEARLGVVVTVPGGALVVRPQVGPASVAGAGDVDTRKLPGGGVEVEIAGSYLDVSQRPSSRFGHSPLIGGSVENR